jgi:hypothetical protein
VWDVTSVEVFIETDDLMSLFTRRDEPLMTVDVTKELFPSLFADPYRSRVHTIGGFDDLTKGTHEGLRVMEVDGHPTLVTEGTGESVWVSPIYHFDKSFELTSAAWDLGTSKRTPADGFDYTIKLHAWQSGEDTGSPASMVVDLADGLTPAANRIKEGLSAKASDVAAYQIEFRAAVTHDTYLSERHLSGSDGQTLGRPVLRSLNLLEKREPTLTFHSLRELMLASNGYHLIDEAGPPRRLTASLDVSAALSEGERIELTINHNGFTTVEARLDATIQMRPPITG